MACRQTKRERANIVANYDVFELYIKTETKFSHPFETVTKTIFSEVILEKIQDEEIFKHLYIIITEMN